MTIRIEIESDEQHVFTPEQVKIHFWRLVEDELTGNKIPTGPRSLPVPPAFAQQLTDALNAKVSDTKVMQLVNAEKARILAAKQQGPV